MVQSINCSKYIVFVKEIVSVAMFGCLNTKRFCTIFKE